MIIMKVQVDILSKPGDLLSKNVVRGSKVSLAKEIGTSKQAFLSEDSS